MKKLLLKSLFLLTPFLVLLGYFVWEDPMKIIHNTSDPVSPGVLMNDRLFQARFLEATAQKNPETYNAFIFGSSRSRAFKTHAWKKQLPEDARPFHMGVNDESLYGVERKLHFLDSLGFDPKYVLIQLDHRLLSLLKNNEAHIFRDYYAVTGETAASFYQRFFIAFLNPSFLKNYWKYKRTGDVGESGNFLWDPGFEYDQKTGDIDYARYDREIAKDSVKFYTDNASTFYERTPSVSGKLTNADARTLLVRIKQLLDKHKTEFRIIVSPNYDMVQLHPEDLLYLKQLFGSENVFDFSGNNSITEKKGNYYEHKHFKPYIANQLMRDTYAR